MRKSLEDVSLLHWLHLSEANSFKFSQFLPKTWLCLSTSGTQFESRQQTLASLPAMTALAQPCCCYMDVRNILYVDHILFSQALYPISFTLRLS